MKGFTLVEMLATVIVLGIIIGISTPLVINTINDSRQKAYENQLEMIEKAASTWGANHLNQMPKANESLTIHLSDLKAENLIKDSFVNQVTNEEFDDNLEIIIESVGTGFKYTVVE